MKTKSKLIAGMLAAGVILTLIAGVSLAAKSGRVSARQGVAAGCQGNFYGSVDDLSKLIELKPDQITDRQKKGESLASIAKSQGVSEDAVVSVIANRCKTRLDERVKAGTITQEQVSSMLDRMKTIIADGIKTPGITSGCGMSGMMSGRAGVGCGNGAGHGMGYSLLGMAHGAGSRAACNLSK